MNISLLFSLILSLAFVLYRYYGLYLRKRDIVRYFERFKTRHNKDEAVYDLKKIKKGMEKYGMTKGWPGNLSFFKMADEDLSEFNQTIESAIKEGKEADNVAQIKQKIAIMETDFERVIYRNYNWNIYQEGIYAFLFSLFFFACGILIFFRELTTLLYL